MSIVKLTKDLENFKWTNYSNAGDNNSPITRDREGAQFNKPQSFYDGHSKVVTGKQTFNRPDSQALEDMESKFGPFNTQPNSRGPYGVSDYMWGRKQGRGFTAPGQAPLGFTVDMQSLTADVKSEIEIDGDLSLTPLSYVVAGVNSALDYGSVPSSMISTIPSTPGAYGVNDLPISTYSSRILARPELDSFTSSPIEGRVSYYGRLESLYNKNSMFEKEDGTYSTPIGQSTRPGFQTEFQNFMEFGGRGIQRTFEIPREYPNNTTAYKIDSQISSNWQSPTLKPSGYGVFPSIVTGGSAEVRFDALWKSSSGMWPYNVFGFEGDHPLIRKSVGDRIPIGTGYDWVALQVTKAGEDVNRINAWLDTPAGKLWQDKQHMLQDLNPREETRIWSKSNMVLSIPPLVHATRHFDGETYMEKADFGPIFFGDSPSGEGTIASLFGQTKFAKWVGNTKTAISIKKFSEKMNALGGMVSSAAAGLDSAFGGIDFNEEGGRLQFLTGKMIALPSDEGSFGMAITNMRNSHSPFGRPPKIPTQVVFSQKGAFGRGDAHSNTILNQKGDSGDILLQRYKTLAYGELGGPDHEMDYIPPAFMGFEDTFPVSPSEIDLDQEGEVWNELKSKRQDGQKVVSDIGDPGKKYDESVDPRVVDNFEEGSGLGLIKKPGGKYRNELTDKINMTPYGWDSSDPNNPDASQVNDFIKFKFRDITNNKYIIFRAILSGISDSITPDWGDTRYIGRPEKVYVYQGADRSVSFSFQVYPKTKQELPVLWEKLNYLVGLCYPDYHANRMVAPFIELTMGDMFNKTPGFLSSLTLEVDDNSTWEIDNGLQFPKHITCQCTFTYVGKYIRHQRGKHYDIGWLPAGTSQDPFGPDDLGFEHFPKREQSWDSRIMNNKGGVFGEIQPGSEAPETENP